MNKEYLRSVVVEQLTEDYRLLLRAAVRAHEAATDEESVPDNKYDTRALEASYIAQGQADRARDIGAAIRAMKGMVVREFDDASAARLSALVLLLDEQDQEKRVFLTPAAGGLTVCFEGTDILLVTPASPLGRALIGSLCGDLLRVGGKEYEIVEIR
jgi:transcription elongation GreA/GreB family factor